ncbi:luciferin 4-monooxygenase-like [Anopheles aquasalis]|uniref:luciferin 4-monooxygenase-like n=1 Tax=Anopheles aquasalis TaxID=42839 RepID=UPI00215A686C|nr:luciferin 4-monooxygenase-like [Anopheles aquasalis]
MANWAAVFDVISKSWRGAPLPSLYNPHQSLGELLFRALQRAPTHVAQVSADTGRIVTYRELFHWSVRIAQSLPAKCGVVPKDIIAVVVRNGEKVAPLVFGCFMANIAIIALDPSFRVEDYEHLIGLVRPKMVVCDPDLISILRLVFVKLTFEPQLLVMDGPGDDCLTIDDLLQPTGNEKNFTPGHLPNPSTELAYILCSSGTTGLAKGVCMSHSACIGRITRVFEAYLTDRILCFSSLYWISGFGALLVGTMSGATRIITRDPWSAGLTLDLIERYRVTILFLPPPHLTQLLVNGTIGMADFSSVRHLLTSGGPLPDEVKCSMERYLTHPEAAVLPCYGLTEFCGVSMGTRRHYKPDSVGEVNPCVEAKIVGEDGMPLDCDQEGELLLRSDFTFLGYYDNPTATSEVLDPDTGWLRTGDIARYDADGMFYIVGRKKEIMKYGGYQVSPLELEQTIFRLFGDGVGSLTRALRLVCVAGVHERGNDLPVTLAVRLPGVSISEQEIVDGVADVVADCKRLRGGVFFVDNLPLTSSGKIARKRCRDLALQLYKEREQDAANEMME